MHSGYETFQQTRYFGSLDGLRCLSILAVVWHHTATPLLPAIPLLGRGYLGVELFFAISGFLITTLLLRERRQNGAISLGNFYLRRTFRIFPLYYTVLLVYVLLVWRMERGSVAGHAFFHNLPSYLTYTSNWFVDLTDGRVIFYFAWSLAAEEQFYLLWPTVERFLRGWRPVAIMIGVIALSHAVGAGMLGRWLDAEGLLHHVIARAPLPICLGVLLAHLLDHPQGYAASRRLVGWRGSSAIALGLLAVCLAWESMPAAGIHCLIIVLVAACVVREDHALAWLLQWRPVAFLGTISYGMYLMHMLAYHVATRLLPTDCLNRPLLVFAATVLVVTVAAGLSYRYYERFFLRLKDRFRADGSEEAESAGVSDPVFPATDNAARAEG